MKKNNKKGFMLAETLIVSTFIVGVLLFIYIQLRNINNNYSKTLAYNDVTAIYSANNIRNFLLQDNYEEIKTYFHNNFSLDEANPLVYLDLTTCPTDFINEEGYCQELLNQLNIKQLLFTDETNEYLLRFIDDDNNLSSNMKNFIKSQKVDNEIAKYRIYIETNDGKLATIKMEKAGSSDPIVETVSFSEDSWETIALAVSLGQTDNYNVGDTKEVEVTGYGIFTVRIANKSTPSECNTSGFSGTACGFVVEFVDVITTHNMNSTSTNVGGWPGSAMRSFVNDTIYNALPEDLRNVIADTYVVSSHGESDSTNFTSTDKLYLLSTKEVWGKSGTGNTINYDTAEAETRQLDYYTNLGVSTSNYSGAIKYDASGTATRWWLRSAYSSDSNDFYYVGTSGDWYTGNANSTYGCCPAFRLS